MNNSIEMFVPGRLCLFGEHSDWAGLHRSMNADIVPGMAIVSGIEEGIYARAQKAEQFILETENSEAAPFSCEMDTEKLRAVAQNGQFYSYVAGVASYINEYYRVGGLRLTITKSTLPIKKGLSSSAAICVLVARAFNLIYDLKLSIASEMEIAFH